MREPTLARRVGPVEPIPLPEAADRLRRASELLLAAPHLSLTELLVSTPLIRSLRRALPETRLTLAAAPESMPAVADNPDLDRRVPVRLTGLSAPFTSFTLSRRLKKLRFDAALILGAGNLSPSAILFARRCRPGFTAALDDAPLGTHLARIGCECAVPLPGDSRSHVVDLHLSLIEQLGIPAPDRRQVLAVTEEQRTRAWKRLREAGIDPAAPRIGLHVREGSDGGDGAWPPSHHASILQRAALEMGYQPLLLGEERDRAAMEQVVSLGRSAIPALVGLSFEEYKAVASCLNYFVCDDGGPVHLAAAVGVPSFFLFLSTPAWRWAPYGPHVNVWDESERPGRLPPPLEVWERVKPLLAGAKAEDRAAG